MQGRHVIVGDMAAEDRVRPVVVIQPFRTIDGFWAQAGDELRLVPSEIAQRTAAHQVRALADDPYLPVRRFGRTVIRSTGRGINRRRTP